MSLTISERLDEAIALLTPRATGSRECARALIAAERIKETLARPPRIAMAGEFSAGKSSVANLLLGESVIPTRILATPLPTTHLWYGQKPEAHINFPDGRREEVEIVSLADHDFMDAELLEVRLPHPALRRFELLDTPGLGDPQRQFDQMESMVKRAHLTIWCTNITQAWRETERRVWAALPTRLRRDSLLILTHSDLMRNPKDLNKVLKRVGDQASELFRAIIPLAILDAMDARDEDGQVVDQDMWRNSGGKAFFDSLDGRLESINASRETAATESFDRLVAEVLEKARTVPVGEMLLGAEHETIGKAAGQDDAAAKAAELKAAEEKAEAERLEAQKEAEEKAAAEAAAAKKAAAEKAKADRLAARKLAEEKAAAKKAAAEEKAAAKKAAAEKAEARKAEAAKKAEARKAKAAGKTAAKKAAPAPAAPAIAAAAPAMVDRDERRPATPRAAAPVYEPSTPDEEALMAFSGLIDAILGEVDSAASASEIESIASSAAQAVEDYATLTLYPWLEEREQSYDGLLEIFTLSGEAVLKTASGKDAEDPDQRLRSILYQLEAEIGDVLAGRCGISA